MYIIKIQTTNGDWILKQSESIQYSDSPFHLTPDEIDRSSYWSPFIPKAIREIFDKSEVNRDVEIIPFNDNVWYDYTPQGQGHKGWSYTPNNSDTPNIFVKYAAPIVSENVSTEKFPDGWFFGYPMYSYIILDNKKAVVFPTKAFICNNEGKTIQKIGS